MSDGTIDREAIVLAAASRHSLRDVAQMYNLTLAEVRKILDEEAAEAFSGENLRREWLLEAKRLRILGHKYFERAMIGDGDTYSAAIYIKTSERLATLTGQNAPIGHAVQVMHSVAPPRKTTSLDELRSVLDALGNVTPRERELVNRLQFAGEDTPEIRAEINQLRIARGKPALADDGLPD